MVNMGFRHGGCEKEVNFSQGVFIKHFHCQLFEIHFLPFGNVNIVIFMSLPDTKSKQMHSMGIRFI